MPVWLTLLPGSRIDAYLLHTRITHANMSAQNNASDTFTFGALKKQHLFTETITQLGGARSVYIFHNSTTLLILLSVSTPQSSTSIEEGSLKVTL